MNPLYLLICLLPAAGQMTSAAKQPDPRTPKRIVTASIPPLAAIVRDLASPDVRVESILPPGADPHGYEPSPRAARLAADARLHFVVGRNLDDWAAALARGSGPDVRVMALADAIQGEEPQVAGEPHVWMDPSKAAWMARRAALALIEAFPDLREPVQRRLEGTIARYARLDSLCAVRLDSVRSVPFAAHHGGLNHLVARYGLNQIGVLEAFHGRETTPRHLKGVVEDLAASGVRVLFVEPQGDLRLARTVSRETGVPIAVVDALMAIDPQRSYESFLLGCVEQVAGALGKEARP